MHIETGVVQGAKMLLSYGTAAAVFGITAKLAIENIKENGILSLGLKSIISAILVLFCFQILPHAPVGVSEVHLILGTTIFLIFGVAPAAIGLALGLLIQGVAFAQFDLPQYGINVTTLLASLFILNVAISKIVPKGTAYQDISYTQMLKISAIWQGAIVTWVAFWVFYGQGFTTETMSSVFTFGGAYISVIALEPFIDLAVLAGLKAIHKNKESLFFDKQLIKAKA